MDGSRKVGSLSEDDSLYMRKDTAFLLALVEGPKSLYQYVDRMGVEHFFIRNESGFKALIDHHYLAFHDGLTSKVRREYYKKELFDYLEGCGSLMEILEKSDYKQKNLISLFEDYYACNKENPDYSIALASPTISFGLIAGVKSEKMRFQSGDYFTFLTEPTYPDHTGPEFGLFFMIPIERNFQRTSLYNELSYTRFSTEGLYTDFRNENWYDEYTTRIGYSGWKISTLLRYRFSINKGEGFFLQGGLTNIFARNDQFQRRRKVFYSTDETTESYGIYVAKRHNIGFAGGLGFMKKKIFIELRGEITKGNSAILNLKNPSNKGYLMLGYIL
ncbi:MAG: hypothetical protein R3B47_14740 [Bacteroidia bacterium]